MADIIQVIQEGVALVTVNISTTGIPQGGVAGQVLAKTADSDFAVGWIDGGSGSGGMQEFDTVADMIANTDVDWVFGACNNFLPGDKHFSAWVRLRGTTLTENGSDVLAAFDGSLLVRYYLREYLGSELVITASTTPYTIAGLTVFPSLADARNSMVNTLKTEILPEVDGNGGGDGNGEFAAFVRGSSPVGVDGVDYFVNAAGIVYLRIP